MTTVTPEEREILKKLKSQHWDIDEGDLSIYRHVDDRHVHLAEIDDPAETARELVLAWRIATSLIGALEAVEDRAEKVERERDVLIEHFHVDECPVERGFDTPDWCASEEQCGDWTCDFGVADCWRKWAAQKVTEEA